MDKSASATLPSATASATASTNDDEFLDQEQEEILGVLRASTNDLGEEAARAINGMEGMLLSFRKIATGITTLTRRQAQRADLVTLTAHFTAIIDGRLKAQTDASLRTFTRSRTKLTPSYSQDLHAQIQQVVETSSDLANTVGDMDTRHTTAFEQLNGDLQAMEHSVR